MIPITSFHDLEKSFTFREGLQKPIEVIAGNIVKVVQSDLINLTDHFSNIPAVGSIAELRGHAMSTVLPGSLGFLPRCSAHRATPARPQVANRGMAFRILS